MHVLALGFGRIGTTSLKIALEMLVQAYMRTSHAYIIASHSSPEVIDMWTVAIKAKFYGEATPFGREIQAIGAIIIIMQTVTDASHLLPAAELVAAYPAAKVALTKRSMESWWKSYEATIVPALKPSLQLRLLRWLDPVNSVKRERLLQLIAEALFGTGLEHVAEDIAKALFLAHYDEVRRLAPKDRLLEFEVKEAIDESSGQGGAGFAFPKRQ
ncbi:hypothetical protein FB451DRAFT_1397599 [Mycena latifolia]|nr:hypothetical protein FB451DRAFT_1397599 [Mycena latifolia]